MANIAVIGGGAAGMMAAITAAEDRNNRVFLIEKQPRVGKKLLATGNGKCNLSNLNAAEAFYSGKNPEFVVSILKQFGVKDTLVFFNSLGLLIKAEEGGRVYPYTGQAASVLDVLRFDIEKKDNIRLMLQTRVRQIDKQSRGFHVVFEDGKIFADKVIVAAGGAASPKLGGCEDGYALLKAFGHSMTKMNPCLVQLKTDNSFTRTLKGIKVDAGVAVYYGKSQVKSSCGELLFTDYGLSGPVILDISRYAVMGGEKEVYVTLDFMPEYGIEEVKDMIESRLEKGLEIENILVGMLHKKLGMMLIKFSGFQLGEKAESLDGKDVEKIAHGVKGFTLKVTGNLGFENAQVTMGGADTDEFDNNTLESKRVKGLYAAGEVLDIDGDCGGFNLQWAWSSGRVAGKLGKI